MRRLHQTQGFKEVSTSYGLLPTFSSALAEVVESHGIAGNVVPYGLSRMYSLQWLLWGVLG